MLLLIGCQRVRYRAADLFAQSSQIQIPGIDYPIRVTEEVE